MPQEHAPLSRAYAIGLASGALWMIFVSAIYLVAALWALHLSGVSAVLLWAATLCIEAALLIAGIRFLRKGLALPRNQSPEAAARGRRIGWRFGGIVLVELIASALASNLCVWLKHEEWIVPLNLLIVGVHFLLLAWLFHVRPYWLLGILWCLIVLIVLITTPATLTLGPGQVSAWILLPVIGCVLVTWPIVVYLLVQGMQTLQHQPNAS